MNYLHVRCIAGPFEKYLAKVLFEDVIDLLYSSFSTNPFFFIFIIMHMYFTTDTLKPKMKNKDSDGTGIKPIYQYSSEYRVTLRGYGINDYIYLSTDFDKTMKRSRVNFQKKTSGYLYLPGSKYLQKESNLDLRSCLHDAVVNSALHI